MRLFTALMLAFVCSTAAAAGDVTKKTEVLSEETVQAVNGTYSLRTICISSSNYDSFKSREFCMDSASTINMISTDRVMMSANCFPDTQPHRCSDYNAYILRTRMSVF